jgi:Zn-finger nucleic acid-binding protein
MNCPQCKGYQLEPVEIEAGLIAAKCSKCNGTQLPLMNYRFWLDRFGDVEKDSVELPVAEDNNKALACPKCARLMTKFKVGVATTHRIDLCTGCDEAWLDNGEWRLLKQLDLHDKLPKIFTDAWQRNIRIERQQNFIDQRYQTLIGEEDFARLSEFKKWLDQHSEKEQIKQYLINQPS